MQLDEEGDAPDVGYWGSATIVLFSDGEDQGEDTVTDAAAAVAQGAGVRIQTVGVGTTEGTTVEVDGVRLHSALDEESLTHIAETTNGEYRAVSEVGALDSIASTIDLRLEVADRAVPLAGALIVAAILLLAAGAAITVIRTGRIV